MERIKFRVYGITYSQVQTGAYALILSQEDGPYRIPIVIGIPEAQSIAVKLENINPSRPVCHDLFVKFSHGFGITLDEIFIYKFKDGIFYSEMKFSSDDRQISVDARTSDAIAIAMRTDAPIYTTREIMETTGIMVNDDDEDDSPIPAPQPKREIKLENLAIEELEKMMQRHADNEEYERAAHIKEIIAQKLGANNRNN